MILQSDPRHKMYSNGLNADNGCTTMLPFWTANRVIGFQTSIKIINLRIKKWKKNLWVTRDLTINDWESIHEDLGLRVIYHGHRDPEMVLESNQFAYGKFVNNQYDHFVALGSCISNWIVTYDPLGRSNTVAKGHLESIRLFSLV